MKWSLVKSATYSAYVGKDLYLNLTAWEGSCCHSVGLMFKYLF